jgi:hypothetical protein
MNFIAVLLRLGLWACSTHTSNETCAYRHGFTQKNSGDEAIGRIAPVAPPRANPKPKILNHRGTEGTETGQRKSSAGSPIGHLIGMLFFI